MFNVRTALAVTAAVIVTVGVAVRAATGPSSSESPYLVRTVPGVVTQSILTTGDSVGGYRMVGIPDGLGAFDNGDGTFTLLTNHELVATAGVPRAHGGKGAFVSKWVISKDDLTVLSGEDLIHQVYDWTVAGYVQASNLVFVRFCSATLAPISAFYNAASGLGYNNHIFTNGEENGTNGRAWGHVMDGRTFRLARMGRYAFENVVPHPHAGDRTVVGALDDSGNGQVYFYAGTKTVDANPVVAAGLTNGTLYGVKVSGLVNETDATVVAPNTPLTLASLGDVSLKSGAELQTDSEAAGLSGFQRPEDGTWDPWHPNDFYFVTTASFTGRSRLWRLRFTDATTPWLGGTTTMLLNGTEGQHMFDNITIDRRGHVMLQEDVGENAHIGKIWQYNVETGVLTMVAQHDPGRFAPGAPDFLTVDEESSGIIDASDVLGEGWFLLDVQAHYPQPGELVEGGQLLALHVAPGKKF